MLLLKLYTAGTSLRSQQAVSDLTRLCLQASPNDYEVVVVDVLRQWHLLTGQQIHPKSEVMEHLPAWMHPMLNEMSAPDGVLVGLDLLDMTQAGATERLVGEVSHTQAVESQLWLLQSCVERLNDIVLITEADPIDEPGPRIVFVNEAFERRTGYSRAEAIGRTPRILQGPATSREALDRIRGAMQRMEPVREQLLNYTKAGQELWLELDIVPIRDQSGKLTHFAAIERDVTEKQRIATELEGYRNGLEELVSERTRELAEARVQAEAASEAKTMFLANMSHEIRTPMNGVLGMLDVFEQTQLDGQQREMLRAMRVSGNALLGIIDDILDFTRIEAGKLEIARGPVPIRELVEGLCDSLVPMAYKRGVDVTVFVDPVLPHTVLADALRLRQVLYNLIGNAIKFSAGRRSTRGSVDVRVCSIRLSPLQVRFTVADNGIGMAPETVEKLFRPFSQADAATTRRFGGTGLGVTIPRQSRGLSSCEPLKAACRGR